MRTIEFDPSGAVLSVSETPDTTRDDHILSRRAFIARFTPAEFVAIVDHTDATVRYIHAQTLAADYIDLTDEQTIQGVGYLASVGVLTEARAAEVLRP